MPDVVSTARDEEVRRRAEAQQHQTQQQLDEMRRQFREVIARQQWLEDLYKQSEGRLAQFQIGQDQFAQTITQALNARQEGDQRVKQQLAELMAHADDPLKLLRELRAQVTELADSRRTDRDRVAGELRQFEGLQGQLRELVAQIGLLADGQRQLRELIQDLDQVNKETRQEIQRVNELQRIEEQRLRRQGSELQEIVEGIRLQFQDTTARAQRIDDVRRQLIERTEALESVATELRQEDQRQETIMGRLEKQMLENHLQTQERNETIRATIEAELAELRQINDTRVDRNLGRFQTVEDRLRDTEQRLTELPPQFERLTIRDMEIEAEREAIEEWCLRQDMENLETQIEELRARRARKQVELAKKEPPGLIRSVREARSPVRPDDDLPPGTSGAR